jgi:hypothetical protein
MRKTLQARGKHDFFLPVMNMLFLRAICSLGGLFFLDFSLRILDN